MSGTLHTTGTVSYLLRSFEHPDQVRAWLKDELIPHLEGREHAARGTSKAPIQPWVDLRHALELVVEEDATSKVDAGVEADDLKEDLDKAETALETALVAYHEAHPEPHTRDLKLCQHVECSRLQHAYRGSHLSDDDRERIRS